MNRGTADREISEYRQSKRRDYHVAKRSVLANHSQQCRLHVYDFDSLSVRKDGGLHSASRAHLQTIVMTEIPCSRR